MQPILHVAVICVHNAVQLCQSPKRLNLTHQMVRISRMWCMKVQPAHPIRIAVWGSVVGIATNNPNSWLRHGPAAAAKIWLLFFESTSLHSVVDDFVISIGLFHKPLRFTSYGRHSPFRLRHTLVANLRFAPFSRSPAWAISAEMDAAARIAYKGLRIASFGSQLK